MTQYLTTKEEAFARAFIKYGTVAAAYKAVVPHVKETRATAAGTAYARKPEVRELILSLLQASKRTMPATLVDKLGELTEATKEVVTRDGDIVQVKDNPVRLDAVKTALKIYGVPSDMDVDINSQVMIEIKPADEERLLKIVNWMDRVNRDLIEVTANVVEEKVVDVNQKQELVDEKSV